MFRNVLIGVVGLVFCFILLGSAGWLMFTLSGERELFQALDAGTMSKEEFAAAFFEASERKIFITQVLALPLIAMITGGFIGLFARDRIWLPTLAGIIPLLFFVFEISVRGAVLSVVYVLLAVSTATMANRFRSPNVAGAAD